MTALSLSDRGRLGEERKLIFVNFCNQVPKEELAEGFERSVAEIEREIAFVARKIIEYRSLHGRGLAQWVNAEGQKQWHAKWSRVPAHRRPPAPQSGDELASIRCDTESEILGNMGALLWTLDLIDPLFLAGDIEAAPIAVAISKAPAPFGFHARTIPHLRVS